MYIGAAVSDERAQRVAAVLANARGARNGMPAVTNVLDILRSSPRLMKLYDEVMEDARSALAIADETSGFGELRRALDESVKLQSHYAACLNDLDGGRRMLFGSSQEWIDRLALLEKSPEAAALEADIYQAHRAIAEAQKMSGVVSRTLHCGLFHANQVLDEMVKRGLITAADGRGQRTLLVQPERSDKSTGEPT